mgnify:CR=1 FL=1
MKIKKGDNVIIIAGKDRGRQGKVARVFPRLHKLIVGGANLKKRHERPRQQGKKGQIVTAAAPLAVSNVMIYCSNCGKGVRVGVKVGANKSKIRVCKKCGKEI